MIPQLHLTLLTRDPDWIQAAEGAGIPRIGIDIERIGKQERQSQVTNARISDHELQDLRIVTTHSRLAKPFARLNRPHAGTAAEIDEAIACGARSLMLPGFDTPRQAATFIEHVAGRAEAILLLETRSATEQLDRILKLTGIDELMVGLNDMSLQFKLAGPMAMALDPLLDTIADKVRSAGIPFGFGGVARPERRDLPTSPDLLLARYAQLGATRAWIARSFTNDGLQPNQLAEALARLQQRYADWCQCDEATRAEALATLRAQAASNHPSST